MEAEGLAEAVERLRDAVGAGPPQAEVTGVEDLEVSKEPLPDTFEIRYSEPGAYP